MSNLNTEQRRHAVPSSLALYNNLGHRNTQEQAHIINDEGYDGDDESNGNDSDSNEHEGSSRSARSEDRCLFLEPSHTDDGDYVFSQSALEASFTSAMLDAFPTDWHLHIMSATQQWKRYIALVEPFSCNYTQWAKVKKFVSKILDKIAARDQGKKQSIYYCIKYSCPPLRSRQNSCDPSPCRRFFCLETTQT